MIRLDSITQANKILTENNLWGEIQNSDNSICKNIRTLGSLYNQFKDKGSKSLLLSAIEDFLKIKNITENELEKIK